MTYGIVGVSENLKIGETGRAITINGPASSSFGVIVQAKGLCASGGDVQGYAL